MKSDRFYLEHIADSIRAVENYVAGGRDIFLREWIIQDAVIRNLEIIGEAAGKLSPKLRASSPAPWKKIVAFRNRLIHAYWGVDLLLVWDVISKDLRRSGRRLSACSPSEAIRLLYLKNPTISFTAFIFSRAMARARSEPSRSTWSI